MKTLNLLGLGISLYETPPTPKEGVDVWGLQYTWKSHHLSRAFMMDDESWIIAKNNTLGQDIVKEVNSYDFPVYVSRPWADLRHWVEYPLEYVISGIPNLKHRILEQTERGKEFKEVQGKYFLNSFCYMLALAIFEGYERIELFGLDMGADFLTIKDLIKNGINKDDLSDRVIDWVDQRDCMNFWIGVAIGRGIEVVVSEGSRMTKPLSPTSPTLYAYEENQTLKKIRDGVLASNKQVEKLFNTGKSLKSLQIKGDRIIDLTKSGLKFNVYHKEDLPPGAKAGDIVAEAKPYVEIN